MDGLAALVQALPQELYDEIFELSFTPNTDSITINESYNPPSCLQVNRSTRDSFARKYYSEGPIFYVGVTKESSEGRWISSLGPNHQAMLRNIRVKGIKVNVPKYESCSSVRRRLEVRRVIETLPKDSSANYFEPRYEKFRVLLWYEESEMWLSPEDVPITQKTIGDWVRGRKEQGYLLE